MIHEKSIAELAKGLRSGDYTSRELTQSFLSRIRRFPELNAYITVTEELALNQADAADRRIAGGDESLLTGIPIRTRTSFVPTELKPAAVQKCSIILRRHTTPR